MGVIKKPHRTIAAGLKEELRVNVSTRLCLICEFYSNVTIIS